MKLTHIIILTEIVFVLFPFISDAQSKKLKADARKADIVIASDATLMEQKAAMQLSIYLHDIYPGYMFSVTNTINSNNFSIKLGLSGKLKPGESIRKEIPEKEEGFLIRQLNEKDVIILSRSDKGLFNAVYSLLEKLGYGFYLSYDIKPMPKKVLDFKEWESKIGVSQMSDFPLQPVRMVFNWHNFVSGCTGWNYEDWCSWIDQSAKMRYNTIMVHAYGNNPMFSFDYNGLKKTIGYLTTSRSGRDWGAEHVDDIRKLPGGKIFSGPVLGSEAAMVPDEERGKAATQLMSRVFKYAGELGMKINFAIDVDTWNANPRNIIESLPAECRIKLNEQDIVDPDTEAGYQYYKAQVKKLLTDYPQISTITPWVRNETSNGSIWTRLKPAQFPASWRKDWERLINNHPEMEKYRFGPAMFGFSKIVAAYQKALKEINRTDVTVAFGSWGWEFLPYADLVMPGDCPLIPLDSRMNIETEESRRILSETGSKRKVFPIIWAHDDDHRYMGRPFTPFKNLNTLLKERNAAGFGIIHWTTRPLDLYFKSIADQVWNSSENKSLASTIADYSGKIFGSQQDRMDEYLNEWITNGPMFGRETTDHFFDLPRPQPAIKDEPIHVTIEKINHRISVLKRVNLSNLSPEGRKMYDYYFGMEQFYLNLFQNQDKFNKAFYMLGRQSLDSARAVLQIVNPEKSIELYAEASTKLPITAGEKALIFSMGTRWLPDFINLKQRARMTDILYKFQPTQHDTLAQQPGTFTYYIDTEKNLWSCLGEKELKLVKAGSFNESESSKYPENSRTYIQVKAPINIPLVTFGKNPLTPGKYKLEIRYTSSSGEKDCKLYLIGKNSHDPIKSELHDQISGLSVISSIFDIKDFQMNSLEIDPGNGSKLFTNLVIKPI